MFEESLAQLHENATNAGIDDIIVHDIIDDLPNFGMLKIAALQSLKAHDGKVFYVDYKDSDVDLPDGKFSMSLTNKPIRAHAHFIPVLDAKNINQLIQFTTASVAVNTLSRTISLIRRNSKDVQVKDINELENDLDAQSKSLCQFYKKISGYNWMLVDGAMLQELKRSAAFKANQDSKTYRGDVVDVGTFRGCDVLLYNQAACDPAWRGSRMALVGYRGDDPFDTFLIWSPYQVAITRSENPHRVDMQDAIVATPTCSFIQYKL